ncbi:MAG: Holliday junction ATP-dependent DNA helicase RuvA [Aquiluna sp.]|nr:Holliday junction ATP-dependent DNA helicase RuvA [Aquiluna sp.]
MISSLQGSISAIGTDRVTLVLGGIGFSIQVTSRHAAKLEVGQELLLQTKLVVREDDLSLFGFQDQEEASLFEHLCSVNGIGPKLAMTTLSGLPPQLLVNAINSQDESAFRAVQGIGPKTAKLVLITLQGKVGLSKGVRLNENVLQAMLQLGGDEASSRKLLATLDQTLSESDMLKLALSKLGRSKLGS